MGRMQLAVIHGLRTTDSRTTKEAKRVEKTTEKRRIELTADLRRLTQIGVEGIETTEIDKPVLTRIR